MTLRPRPVLGLVLTPGASADRNHASLLAIEEALAGDPVAVERIDLPRGKAERAVGAVGKAAAALAERTGLASDRLLLGGRSFGARVCSMAVADGLPAAGLVLVSYPLHPPGKPDQLRTEHFARLEVPCLFLSGTRDAFATRAELEAASAGIPGPVTHLWEEGGSHGLRGRDATVAAAVRGWITGFLGTFVP